MIKLITGLLLISFSANAAWELQSKTNRMNDDIERFAVAKNGDFMFYIYEYKDFRGETWYAAAFKIIKGSEQINYRTKSVWLRVDKNEARIQEVTAWKPKIIRFKISEYLINQIESGRQFLIGYTGTRAQSKTVAFDLSGSRKVIRRAMPSLSR